MIEQDSGRVSPQNRPAAQAHPGCGSVGTDLSTRSGVPARSGQDAPAERTCNGKCCAVFTLHTPVAEHYGEFIADMAVALTPEQAVERGARFGVPSEQCQSYPEHGWMPHTCRHWDEETRLCTVYEQRPPMCRDYPYENPCRHGCGYEAPAPVQMKWRNYRHERYCCGDPGDCGESCKGAPMPEVAAAA